MPTYGYECLSCHTQTEVIQSIKDAPLTTCDVCGGTLRKRIYPVGIAFKGSGFYVNDYGKPAPKPDTGGPSEVKSEPRAESNAEAKTESKAETPKAETPKTETPKAEPNSAASAA